MKRVLLALVLLLSAVHPSPAAPVFVSQAVFSITSAAKTATPNLRVAPMTPKIIGKDANAFGLQWFQWQANQTQNLYLTKNTTVSLSDALCAWIQVDQATKMKLNSESNYMILPSGYSGTVCFK